MVCDFLCVHAKMNVAFNAIKYMRSHSQPLKAFHTVTAECVPCMQNEVHVGWRGRAQKLFCQREREGEL